MSIVAPADIDALCALVNEARISGETLAISGGGSKAPIGEPCDATIVDMRRFTGIIDYDPAELVLTARPGTPLAEIEAALAGQNQMLAFDPWDHGPLFGQPTGAATIGGIVAAGVAGPRRLSAGGARDHLLGFTAVSGKGETFVAGGKVVKNVTGFDLSKLVAGSWGRLVAMTELSLKVLPRPRVSVTLATERLSAVLARTLMLGALGGSSSVAAAAHLSAAANDGRAVTLLRLEGFGPSVEARAASLARESGDTLIRLADEEAAQLWDHVRTPVRLAGNTLWRAQLPASISASLFEALEQRGAQCLLDWGGSLLWIGWNGRSDAIRPLIEEAGGHAMLVRAPDDVRARIPAQHPRDPGVAALEARVRRAFDPDGVFETGRFGGAAG
jgi:glycolate oxidase FAD binding subunit